MAAGRILTLACMTLLPCMTPGASFAADPATSETGISITGGSETPVAMTADALARLPTRQVTVSFGAARGNRSASFEGPLLWTVLDRAHAIHSDRPGEPARQFVLVTGHDGYTALLGLGEIAPAFEGKPVILAERMNGEPLGAGHFRIVVPGDRRGGRSVRDVAGIAVMSPVAR